MDARPHGSRKAQSETVGGSLGFLARNPLPTRNSRRRRIDGASPAPLGSRATRKHCRSPATGFEPGSLRRTPKNQSQPQHQNFAPNLPFNLNNLVKTHRPSPRFRRFLCAVLKLGGRSNASKEFDPASVNDFPAPPPSSPRKCLNPEAFLPASH